MWCRVPTADPRAASASSVLSGVTSLRRHRDRVREWKSDGEFLCKSNLLSRAALSTRPNPASDWVCRYATCAYAPVHIIYAYMDKGSLTSDLVLYTVAASAFTVIMHEGASKFITLKKTKCDALAKRIAYR